MLYGLLIKKSNQGLCQ